MALVGREGENINLAGLVKLAAMVNMVEVDTSVEVVNLAVMANMVEVDTSMEVVNLAAMANMVEVDKSLEVENIVRLKGAKVIMVATMVGYTIQRDK